MNMGSLGQLGVLGQDPSEAAHVQNDVELELRCPLVMDEISQIF